MSAKSGLVGKKSSRPYLGPSEAIFSIGRKIKKKCQTFFLFSLVGQWAPIHPVWALAAIHPRWGNRYVYLKLFGCWMRMHTHIHT